MFVRTRCVIVFATMALALGSPAPARADEADNFTCRNRISKDSLGVLDGWINARIAEAIERANHRVAAGCDAACLFAELRGRIGSSAPKPITFVPGSRFVQWIDDQPDIERCHLKFSDTIYGARSYNLPFMMPFNGRIIFVADSIRLSGHVVGLDKVDHFIREGLAHWREIDSEGLDIAASMARELGPPRRQWSWTEYGVKGMTLTGVLAYADLAAGYFGYRFWSDVLSVGRPESFVASTGAGAGFTQRRPFSFAAYVNDAWDESINCSVFHPDLAREVEAALKARSMTCPMGDARALARLPDAKLYVNPLYLAGQ